MAEDTQNKFGFIPDEESTTENKFGFIPDEQASAPEKPDYLPEPEPSAEQVSLNKKQEEDARQKQLEEQYSKADSFGRGAAQGATLGFGDEASALLTSLFPTETDQQIGRDFWKRYKMNRDNIRGVNKEAQEANEWSYGGGELVGSIAPTLLPVPGTTSLKAGASGLGKMKTLGQIGSQSLKGATKAGAAYGAATGLGKSEADLTEMSAKNVGSAILDTAVSGGLGAAMGAGLFKVGSGLSNWLKKRAAAKAKQTAAANSIYKDANAADDMVATYKQAFPETADDVTTKALSEDPSERAIADFAMMFDEAATPGGLKGAAAENFVAATGVPAKDLGKRNLQTSIRQFGNFLHNRKVNVNAGTNKPPKFESLVSGANDAQRIADKGNILKQEAGNVMGVVLSAHGRLVDKVYPQLLKMPDKLRKAVTEKMMFNPRNVTSKARQWAAKRYGATDETLELLTKKIDSFEKKFGVPGEAGKRPPSLWEINNFKQELSDVAYKAGDAGEKLKWRAIKDFERIINEELENTVRAAADPELKMALQGGGFLDDATKKVLGIIDDSKFQQAKKDYSVGLLLEKFTGAKAGKETLKDFMGMGDIITGYVAGATFSNPLVGATAAGGKAFLRPRHNALTGTALNALSNTGTKIATKTGQVANKVPGVETIANIVKVAPQKLGRWGGLLNKAYQERGNTSLAATHYLLSQKYPEYRDLISKLMEEADEDDITPEE